MQNCNLCPRECGVNRSEKQGFCGGGASIRAARAGLHFWEEPCISGKKGSGTVFFSGCTLQCCFCQNYPISAQNYGKEISVERLGDIFLELQEQGANNINLVTATPYVPWMIRALDGVKAKLKIPVVYNSSGYEKVETLQLLAGYIDIYLPDIKYYVSDRSKKYSNAADYFDFASKAVLEMFRQVGTYQMQEGQMKRGLIIRHMVMPMGKEDSISILEWIAAHFSPDSILLSLMSQYTPFYKSVDYPEINRRIFTYEYQKVTEKALQLGLRGFMQEKSAAKEEYTPIFDLTGIETRNS